MKKKSCHRINYIFYNSYCYLIDVEMTSIWGKRDVYLTWIGCWRYDVVCINYFPAQKISLFCLHILHLKKKKFHTKYHYFMIFFIYYWIDIKMTSIWRQRDDVNLISFQCWRCDVVCISYILTSSCLPITILQLNRIDSTFRIR